MELADHVKDLVALKFKVDSNKIGLQTDFFDELGADSLEMLSFVSELEKEFSVEVSSDQLDNFYCLENIVNFLTTNIVTRN